MKWKTLVIALVLLLIIFSIAWLVIDIYEDNIGQKPTGPACSYDDPLKSYLNKDPNCTINFLCVKDKVPFSDECGCGCQLKVNTNESKTYCTPAQKSADFCFELYQPVCGWFSNEIQCLRYPCAGSYTNSCFACKDPKVEYWTSGDCPG